MAITFFNFPRRTRVGWRDLRFYSAGERDSKPTTIVISSEVSNPLFLPTVKDCVLS